MLLRKVKPLTTDVYAKVHEKGGPPVLAMSDPDLIGCELSPHGEDDGRGSVCESP